MVAVVLERKTALAGGWCGCVCMCMLPWQGHTGSHRGDRGGLLVGGLWEIRGLGCEVGGRAEGQAQACRGMLSTGMQGHMNKHQHMKVQWGGCRAGCGDMGKQFEFVLGP